MAATKSYQFITSSANNTIRNKILQFFKAKNIKLVEDGNESGLFISDYTAFLKTYTWNNENVKPNPNALVTCSIDRPFFLSSTLHPDFLTGQWIVQIGNEGSNATVSVKLANASGQIVIEHNDHLPEEEVAIETHKIDIQTTQVFEKEIELAINK